MPWPVHPNGLLGAQGGDNDTYKIERSLRFNSADSAYLSRTPASAGNRKTWTWSGWVKRGVIDTSSNRTLIAEGLPSSGNYVTCQFDNSLNSIEFAGYNSGVTTFYKLTSARFRDPSAWYHIVLVMDATNTQARIYVNGSEASYSSSTNPSNTDQNFNRAQEVNMGRFLNGTGYFDGYLTEINFIDGQALTPSSFGETDAITGRWKAKAYSGTYGTNGFYLKFADNSGTTATTLGKDSSGNGNNWTPNNFSVTAGAGNDSLLDSPTNNGTSGNYCTLNPLMKTSATISDGNLKVSNQTAGRVAPAIGTMYADISATSGIYFEVTIDVVGSGSAIGIIRSDIQAYDSSPSTTSGVIGLISTGELYSSGSFIASFATYTTNDILGLYFSSGNLYYAKNGTVMNSGSPVLTGLTGYWTFYTNNVASVGSLGCTVNFGQRPFAYAAPSGFKALCTTNLPTPTIQKPSKYMDVVTYTGTGSALTPTSSLGFSPDLVWIKGRSGATDHALYDAVRGVQNDLVSNSNAGQTSQAQGLTSFNSGGFSIGTLAKLNTNTSTYVAWAWDETPMAGMDIVSYTGNSAARTISHNLGVAPKMIIVKAYGSGETQNWSVYHSSIGNTKGIYLNLTNAASTSSGFWNNTNPTSSVFSVGGSPNAGYDDVNYTGFSYIAYLFAEVEGFSKFGSYTGNGSADGPFVWCGFRPRWVMIKRTDTAGGSWNIRDTSRDLQNTANLGLFANLSNAESTQANIDILSNGLKIRDAGGLETNASGGTYIFAAFAESPFKYARAR